MSAQPLLFSPLTTLFFSQEPVRRSTRGEEEEEKGGTTTPAPPEPFVCVCVCCAPDRVFPSSADRFLDSVSLVEKTTLGHSLLLFFFFYFFILPLLLLVIEKRSVRTKFFVKHRRVLV